MALGIGFVPRNDSSGSGSRCGELLVGDVCDVLFFPTFFDSQKCVFPIVYQNLVMIYTTCFWQVIGHGLWAFPWFPTCSHLKSDDDSRQLRRFAFGDVRCHRSGYCVAITSCGHWQLAYSFFQAMKTDQVSPTVVTYNAVLSSTERSDGQWQLVSDFFNQMSSKMAPDVLTMTSAMTALGKGSQWDVAMKLWEAMHRKSLRSNVITYNAAISCCEKAFQWQLALELFQNMPRTDVITHNAAISSCEKGLQWRLAICIFGQVGSFLWDVKSHLFRCFLVQKWRLAIWTCRNPKRWLAPKKIEPALAERGLSPKFSQESITGPISSPTSTASLPAARVPSGP